MKKTLAALALGTLTLAAGDSTASRAVIKHREHNGVGYDTGYSTAQLFLAPAWKNSLMPFLDLRAHFFNDQRLATNAGIGMRYGADDFTWGANFYYDFRDAKNLDPHQLGGGLEFLSKAFDVRINGYGPIASTGKERAAKFDHFSGNKAIFRRRFVAALPVVDAEVGAPLFSRCDVVNFYGALGFYYLFEKSINGVNLGNEPGGKGRLAMDIINRFNARFDVTYDPIFRWTLQGTAGISIPLGPREKVLKNKNFLCMAKNQLPERVEIIPVLRKSKRVESSNNFIFVDSNSSSNGTFESPFPTLAMAQANSGPGDIIYVFPGAGTYTDQITLQANQQLIGSSAPLTIDGMTLPPQTPGQMPILQAAGITSVFIGQNGTLAGFQINPGATNDVQLLTGGNVSIYGNNFVGISGVTTGLQATPVSNLNLDVYGNTFSMGSVGIDLVPQGSVTVTSNMVRNLFDAQSSRGLLLSPQDSAVTDIVLAGNTITRGSAVGISATDTSNTSFFYSGNLLTKAFGVEPARNFISLAADSSVVNYTATRNTSQFNVRLNDYQYTLNDSASGTFMLNDNILTSGDNNAIFVSLNTSANTDVEIKNNLILARLGNPIRIQGSGSSTSTFSIQNNFIVNPQTNAIALTPTGAGVWTGDITRNRILLGANNGIRIDQTSTSDIAVSVLDNLVVSTVNSAVSLRTQSSSTMCAGLINNRSDKGLSLTNSGGGSTMRVASNDGTFAGAEALNHLGDPNFVSGTITFVPVGTCN